MIHVRAVRPEDAPAWLQMRHALWPDESPSHALEIERFLAGGLTMPLEVLLAVDELNTPIGFVELSIRSYVDGCETDRVAYLEGWYVVPEWRRRGVGRALVAAAEDWARGQGCIEFGSDALLDNAISAAAHRAIGFEETEQLQYFRKVVTAGREPAASSAVSADAFLALVAGRRGHFRLESGHHGGLWLDLDPLFAEPQRIAPFLDVLAAALRPHQIDAVCGALVGGAFLAQLLARSMGVPFCFTNSVMPARTDALYQAQYRLPRAFAGLLAGKRVAIVDDVMSAGSALRGTHAALQAQSVTPVVAGALLVLGTTGERFFAQCGVPVVTATRHDYELWVPSACPLCAAGVPLEDPTELP